MSNKWDKRFMELAQLIASWSKDPSRKVGCVIVDDKRTILATGYNGFPRGVDDSIEERFERPQKYEFTEHAERNAVFSAARNGVKLEGSTIYVPWFTCVDCCRAVIQAGITTMVAEKPDEKQFNDPKWGPGFRTALTMLEESDVKVRWFKE